MTSTTRPSILDGSLSLVPVSFVLPKVALSAGHNGDAVHEFGGLVERPVEPCDSPSKPEEDAGYPRPSATWLHPKPGRSTLANKGRGLVHPSIRPRRLDPPETRRGRVDNPRLVERCDSASRRLLGDASATRAFPRVVAALVAGAAA
jgi:hypothetical protein